MNTINLYIESEFEVTTREGISYLEWNSSRYIPYKTDTRIGELEEYHLLDHIECYIINEVEADYGPNVKVEVTYINLIRAYDEESKKERYF